MSDKKARRKARRIKRQWGGELSADDSDEAFIVEREWAEISDDFLADSDEITNFDFRSSDWE